MVSIVIPAYNAAGYITETINSVYLQTYRPLQIVVVDDASKDETADVVEKVFETGPSDVESSILRVEKNSGTASALRRGFLESKGDYVCWLSADDVFVDPQKTSVQVFQMIKKRSHWSYFRDFYFGSTVRSSRAAFPTYTGAIPLLTRLRIPHRRFMRSLDPIFEHDPELTLMSLLFRNPIFGSSVMIKRRSFERYGLFDPTIGNLDPDGDLWLRYCALGLRPHAISGCPAFYRIHSTQVSQSSTKMMFGKELTRLRILTSLLRQQRLDHFIRKFSPFFVMLHDEIGHQGMPLTTQFVCARILAQRKLYSPAISPFATRVYDAAKENEKFSSVDRTALISSVTKALKSEVYVEFEKLLCEMTSH